jgi:glycosyltransferase involved in cell wall biosynthesis
MMRIAAVTQGLNIPSSRFRVSQLCGPLRLQGYSIDEFTAKRTAYPPTPFLDRVSWGAFSIFDAFRRTLKTRSYDACIIQRELISTIPSFEFLGKRPLISDIDDAIWLNRYGLAANNLAKFSDHIVVGNSFLADYFSKYNTSITVIPTCVDIDRFSPSKKAYQQRGYGVIGWSGTSGGYAYFAPIAAAIGQLLSKHRDWKIRFISDKKPSFPEIPPSQLEYAPWTPEAEVSQFQDVDIGLMPLDDSTYSLGKCSYKMLLYMACGIPVVATNIGMNKELFDSADIGYGVHSPRDWTDALESLITNEGARRDNGANGRRLVVEHYSVQFAAFQWATVLSKYI